MASGVSQHEKAPAVAGAFSWLPGLVGVTVMAVPGVLVGLGRLVDHRGLGGARYKTCEL